MSGGPSGAAVEPELTAPVDLCLPNGRLNPAAIGWSRTPVQNCALPGRWGRRKRWDYWAVTAPGLALCLTVADVDYLALADIWFLDVASGKATNHSAVFPLGAGVHLPDHVGGSSIEVRNRRLEITMAEGPEGTRLVAEHRTRSGAVDFACDVLVERPAGHETLSVVIPWNERQFQCTTKENTRPAHGRVTVAGKDYDVPAGQSWGCLDYGRGRWPYRMTWNWGAASGVAGTRVIGLQFGGKWTAGTGMTENALCIDGRLTKVSEELDWQYDKRDWLRPWQIRTPSSDQVDVTFTPVYDKVTGLSAGVASSRVHQCFGQWSGTVRPDDGDPITFADIFGWAEEASWRW